MKKVLFIDNFDSFTYNLVHYFQICEAEVTILNNEIEANEIHFAAYDMLLLSPGPGNPRTAGNLLSILREGLKKIPIFGVCLGLQAIMEHYNGLIQQLEPKHGIQDEIFHTGSGIYHEISNPMKIGRYHSLGFTDCPDDLLVTSFTKDNIIMSIKHKSLPIYGVQYHPDSILTTEHDNGLKLIRNVLQLVR